MSMNKFRNQLMTMTGLMISNLGFVTTGIVVAINPENSSIIKVQISEAFNNQQALKTGWIPVASPWAGNGFGFFAPPDYNDLVLLIFAEGDMQNPIAALRMFNDEDIALNVPPGECWLVHKSGTFIKLTNDGKLQLNGNIEIDLSSPQINITATTQCQINSPSIHIGDLNLPLYKLITDTVIDLYNNHVHPTPSGTSSPPTVPWAAGNATISLEAN